MMKLRLAVIRRRNSADAFRASHRGAPGGACAASIDGRLSMLPPYVPILACVSPTASARQPSPYKAGEAGLSTAGRPVRAGEAGGRPPAGPAYASISA